MAVNIIPTSYEIVEGHTAEASLFSQLPTNTAVSNVQLVEHGLSSSITSSSSCLEFNLKKNPNYLDLSKTTLYLKLKITNPDGSAIPPTANVTLTNNAIGSIIGQCDVQIGNQSVVKIPAPLFAYKSYIDLLLGTGDEPKETYLSG